MGLARKLDETQLTYVEAMAGYPDVVSSLFSAAVSRGLSPKSRTIGVADGGLGLKEELELQFPRLTFIPSINSGRRLDRPHLQKHLYETADAIGLVGEAREAWRRQHAERIDAGCVREMIAEMRAYEGVGKQRVERLAEYLHRFRDCVHYDAYKECGLPLGSGEETRASAASERASLDSAKTVEVAGRVLATGNHQSHVGSPRFTSRRLVG